MKKTTKWIGKNTKHFWRRCSAAGLSMLLVLSLAACGTSDSKDADKTEGTVVNLQETNAGDMDDRASAAQTFGANTLVNVQSQSEEVAAEEVMEQTPGNVIMGLHEFMLSATEARKGFREHLGEALTSAGLQTSSDNEIIRLDVLEAANVFMVYAGWEEGPEAILDIWSSILDSGKWTVDREAIDGDRLYLLFCNDGVPTAEFCARWFEAEQYFFGVYNTEDYRLEIDITRTEYGYACQLYEPGTQVLYRLSYTSDGTGGGSIGYAAAIAEQPDVLSGSETLTYAKEWPELQDPRQATYILLEDNNMTVSQSGVEKTYPINAAAANSNTGNTTNTTNSGTTTTNTNNTTSTSTQSPLSAEALEYSRVWHGSPVLGSGWSERFALYNDGTFIWGANEMDGATRLRYFAGTWDVKDGQLTLNVQILIGWEGGEVVQNTGIASYGSSEVIMNPEVVVYRCDEVLTLPVSKITYDQERGLDTATFNELQCWDYTAQAEDAMAGFWQSYMNLVERAPITKGQMPVSGLK